MPPVANTRAGSPAQQVKTLHIPYRAFPITAPIHADRTSRTRVVCLGRRSGKSMMASGEGFCMSYDCVKRGVQKPRGLVVSPTNQMLRENWWMFTAMMKEAIVQSVVSEMRLDMGVFGQVDFKSTESQGGAGRGSGYDWAVIDEASRVPKSAYENDIRPALADRLGRSLIISTPRGLNWFYDLYQQGLPDSSTYHPSTRSWHATTMECWESRCAQNMTLIQQYRDEWEMLRATTSNDTFREEYLAEFLAKEGQLFSLKPGLFRGELRGVVPGRHYVAGVDVARKDDWMVTVVIEVESQQVVGMARSRHQDWSLQKAVAITLLDQFPQVLTYVDSTGVGDPIAQDLRRAGINAMDVVFSPKVKSELVENLLMAIDQTYLGIPDQGETQWLMEELRQYESVKHPSGAITYGAPEGKHDDGVTALMLAAWGLHGNWKTPEMATAEVMPWWKRDDAHWEMLKYEEQLSKFQDRYPARSLPQHPNDPAWLTAGIR